MAVPDRIELPAAPKPRRRSPVALGLAVAATLVLGVVGALTSDPRAATAAGGGLAIVILLLLFGVAVAGRIMLVLAARAGTPALVRRLTQMVLWPVVAGVVGTVAAIALSGSSPAASKVGPAIVIAGLLLFVVSIGARIVMARDVRALTARLEQTNLAALDRGGGHLELEVSIPASAPTIEVPFLAGTWAAVELLIGDVAYAWPERVPVRDATGTAELELTTCSLAGWRHAFDTVAWSADKRPPLVDTLRAATGDSRLGDESGVVLYMVRALSPGEKLYVLGDATEVRRGFGYRADGQTRVGDATNRPALVYLGDEGSLRESLAFELRWLPALALLGLIGLTLLTVATA